MSQSALYRYVAGRDEVFDLMADAAAGEIDLEVRPRGEVISDLVALAARAKRVHLRHPWLLDVPVEALWVGSRGIDFLEYALESMAPVDVPGPVKLQAVAVLNTLVQQFARAEVGAGPASQERRQSQVAYLRRTVDDGGHPRLAAALGPSSGGVDEPADMFEQVVVRVLEGMLTTP